jgi:hypothetical protein
VIDLGAYRRFTVSRAESALEALLHQGFKEFTAIKWKTLWCRGPDSNRQAVKRRIFVTPRLSTPTIPGGILVRALDYAFTVATALRCKTRQHMPP